MDWSKGVRLVKKYSDLSSGTTGTGYYTEWVRATRCAYMLIEHQQQ